MTTLFAAILVASALVEAPKLFDYFWESELHHGYEN